MFKLFKKLSQTYRVIKKNLPALKKELFDLTGVTEEVIRKIILIWS